MPISIHLGYEVGVSRRCMVTALRMGTLLLAEQLGWPDALPSSYALGNWMQTNRRLRALRRVRAWAKPTNCTYRRIRQSGGVAMPNIRMYNPGRTIQPSAIHREANFVISMCQAGWGRPSQISNGGDLNAL